MADPIYPDVDARLAEKDELFRIAAQRTVDDAAAGRKVDPHWLKQARGIVARVKPLGRPLSTGE